MTEKIATWAVMIALLVVFTLALVGIEKNSSNYKQVCEAKGKVAVYNGRHWECL